MPAVASHIVRWRRPRSKSAETIPRAYRGPTLYGVLGLSVLLGSANTATPFGASNAVALTVVDSEVFLPTSRIIKPKPVQTGQSTVSTYRY
jgi:hypothetical protein